MFKLSLGFCAIAVLAGQPGTEWTPYSATYRETSTLTDISGHQQKSQTTGEEIRSSDGSLLTTKIAGGERVSAKLWQACGQMIELDYSKKHAVYGTTAPRKHPYEPPDAVVGKMMIDGLPFTGYPIHMSPGSGTGTVWVDMADDIIGKLEYHLPAANGGLRDVVREFTSIDINTPVDASSLRVPAGFAKTLPPAGIPPSCVSE